ncbi:MULTISPECIES: hypothetical protein [unclassified Streptomyces]|uniref:hypothetical protein n=1 Tax=unclassified Streptomyces TaxID=2593676 RepID=UPI0037F62175
MTTRFGPRALLREKAADLLFAPGRLPRDRAAAPSTDAPAGRVYAQVVALLVLVSFRPLASDVLYSAAAYGVRWTPEDLRWIRVCEFVLGGWVFFWLSALVIARTTLDQVSCRRRLMVRGAAVLCGAVSMYAAGLVPCRRTAITVFGCTVAWLAWEVCRAHGVCPAGWFPATARDRLRDWRIATAVSLVCIAAGGLSKLLTGLLTDIDGVPVMRGSQWDVLGIHDVGTIGLAAITAVAVEDFVMVAGTAALLTAIRRPAWEIYTLICLAEVLAHAYMGLPAIAMALYAAGRVWLYRRYQRLLPLMAVHAGIDLSAASVQVLVPGVYRVVPALLIALVVLWTGRRLQAGAAVEERADRYVKQGPAPARHGEAAVGTPHIQDRPRAPAP